MKLVRMGLSSWLHWRLFLQGKGAMVDTDWFPPVDILGDAVEYVFKIDLPDVPPENIRVYVEQDDELVISGERPPPSLTDQECLRIERPHGHFERRFALPEDSSKADIEPLFKECVLELHVRKFGQVNPVTENPAATTSTSKLRLCPRS